MDSFSTATGSQGETAAIELFDSDAERSVLAAMLLDSDAIAVASGIVGAEHFYRTSHQMIFRALVAMREASEKIDLVTVADRMRKRGELEMVGGPAALSAILEYSATSVNTRAHAGIVLKYAQRRQLRAVGRAIEQRVEDATLGVAEVLASVRDELAGMDASNDGGDADRFVAAAVNAVEFADREIEQPRSLMGDGLLIAGGLCIKYGPPGIGKSWHIIAAARALVRGEPWFGIASDPAGCRVGLLQLELPAWFMKRRLLALGVGHQERDRNLLVVCRPNLRGAVDLFRDERDVTRLRRWIERGRLDVLGIDALSRAHTADENDGRELGQVLARLDALRFDTGCALVVVHHERKVQNGGASSDLDALRGSSRLQSDPTALIRVKEVGGLRCITFPKVSFGPTPPDIFFKIGDHGAPVVVDAPATVADKNRGRILDALRKAQGPLNRTDLEKATGLSRSAVTGHLGALLESGAVERVGSNKSSLYCVATDLPGATGSGSRTEADLLATDLPLPTGSGIWQVAASGPCDLPDLPPPTGAAVGLGRSGRSHGRPPEPDARSVGRLQEPAASPEDLPGAAPDPDAVNRVVQAALRAGDAT
jgi:hypothetical protein